LELLDVQLPVKLLDWASENSNRTLLTASSSLYQVPEESEYAKAKSRGRNLLFAKARDLGDRVPKCKILNLHNVYGADQPSDRFVAAVASALRAGETFVVQFPHRRRDFVWIDEVSASILNALNDEGGGLEEVDLGTGNALSLLEAARIIAASVDRPVDAVKPSDNLQSDVVVAAELGGTFGECVTPFEEGIRVSVDTRRGPGR
jgi:nucleoside-diphosphate-sugar epimerase